LKQHVEGVAKAGVGILVCGTMGEAHHLSPEERVTVIKATRETLDGAGFPSLPIIAGTGVGSTRETIARTMEAAEAGADYAIVIPSGYFAATLGPDRRALKKFFEDVSGASTIPIIVYNCKSFLVPRILIHFQLTTSVSFAQIPVRPVESTWTVA
jgi:4-hydroxy-2-oxoglutarate aldolase